MAHPYSGSASYIHANDHLMDDNVPMPSSYYYRQTEWIPVPSSPIYEQASPPRRFTSVPNFSKVRGIRQRNFSISTATTSNPTSSIIISKPPVIPPTPVYQSMTIRFDTPVPWRKQVKGVKRRFQRLREKVSQLLTPSGWIMSPHPRLSMVG